MMRLFPMREFTHTLTIDAAPAAVLDAFFDQEALAVWLRATRSLCVPRPLGSYALEWKPTEWHDEVLGRLGGSFRGTVMEFERGREFFIADAYWLPPDGDPIGPMALEAACTPADNGTELRVRQSGGEESRRASRYYEVLSAGFTSALEDLRKYLEASAAGTSTG
jgi:uncharacterized protein YndB with AHSA1/START domain